MLYFLRSKPDAGKAVKNLFTELDYDNSVCIHALLQASVPTNPPPKVQPIPTHIFQGDVDVNELVDGLARLGIPLTETQLEGLHRDCDVNKDQVFPEATVSFHVSMSILFT